MARSLRAVGGLGFGVQGFVVFRASWLKVTLGAGRALSAGRYRRGVLLLPLNSQVNVERTSCHVS